MGPQNQGFWPKINCSQIKLPNFVSSSGDGSSKMALFDQLSPDGDTKFGNFI